MHVTVCLVMAAQAAIADGTAVEALAAFEGESVVIETRDGRKVPGLLKKVSAAAVVVLSPWDGSVVSLRPADVVGFRVVPKTEPPAPAPAMPTPPAPAPAPVSASSSGQVIISPNLKARSQDDGAILLFPAMKMEAGCQYRLDNEAGAVRLEFVPGAVPALRLPPGGPLEPERRNRIVGCDELMPLSETDIRFLMTLRPVERVKKEYVRRFEEPAEDDAPSARSPKKAMKGQRAEQLLEDAEWDRNAALIIGLGGGALASATAFAGVLIFDPTDPGRQSTGQAVVVASGVLGGVTSIAAVGFGIKSIFEYQDYDRATR